MSAPLGLSAEARELLDVLAEVGLASIEALRDPRGAALDPALDELREAGLASVHLSSRGLRIAAITDAGRRRA